MKLSAWKTITAAAIAIALANTVAAAETNQDLLKRLDEQQKQIDSLKKQVEAAVEATEASDTASASKSSFGGYGELHYGSYDKTAPDSHSGNADRTKALDFHRFVLFFGHQFDEKVRFFSELEIEHSLAGEGKRGEVELEQAFIEYTVNDSFSWKGGLLLMPVGIINETHEPPTFYGVERNRVEGDIIPSTWWEGGAGTTFRFADGLALDTTITSGLFTDGSFNLRNGRQKVSKASADSLAYTGRLKWTAIPGLEVAGSLQYQEDLLQGRGVTANAAEEASAVLAEAHVAWQIGGFDLRALYAQWDIDSSVAKTANKEKQSGWFIEPGYRFTDMFGVFVRYSNWDNGGFTTINGLGTFANQDKESVQFGINVWVHPHVVVKADYEHLTGEAIDGSKDDKGFNLGVGYHF